MAKAPGKFIPSEVEPRSTTPGLVSVGEDFSVTLYTFAGNDQKQILKHNPRRTGATILVDPLITRGIAIMPRSMSAAEQTVIGRQLTPVIMTVDIYRAAMFSDWFAYSAEAGTIQVFEFFSL